MATTPFEQRHPDLGNTPTEPGTFAVRWGDFSLALEAKFSWSCPPVSRKVADASILRKLEVEMIQRALRETGGNQVRAANILGITRTTLRKRIEQYSIRY